MSCSAQKRQTEDWNGWMPGSGGVGLLAQAPNGNPNRDSPQFPSNPVPQHCIPPTDGYLPRSVPPSFTSHTCRPGRVASDLTVCAETKTKPLHVTRPRKESPSITKYNRRVRKYAACTTNSRPARYRTKVRIPVQVQPSQYIHTQPGLGSSAPKQSCCHCGSNHPCLLYTSPSPRDSL